MMREIYERCVVDLVWLGDPEGEGGEERCERRVGVGGEEDGSEDDDEEWEARKRNGRNFWRLWEDWLRNMPTIDAEKKKDGEDEEISDWEDGDDFDDWEEEDDFGSESKEGESRLHSAVTIEQGLAFINRKSKQGATLQGIHELESSTRAKLKAVFNARLWSRIWIVQELACAGDVVLLCGQEKLEWNTLSEFLARPYSGHRHQAPWGRGIINSDMAQIFFPVAEIDMQRAIMRSEQREDTTLLDILSLFSGRDSSDARDRVYGLLGLVSPHLNRLTVDYTDENKPAGVFIEATKEIILQSQNLDVLCQSPWERRGVPQCSRLGPRTESLPSWAVDFAAFGLSRDVGASYHSRELMFANRGIFSAGGEFCEKKCWQVLDGTILRLHGFILGQIGPPQPQPPDEPSDFSPNIWADEITNGLYEATGEPKFQALWRTMVTDCEGYPMSRLDQENIQHDHSIFQTPNSENVKELSCKNMWSRIKHNWAFHMSEEGLFVMAREHVREGDYIAVIEGAKVPLVLQSVSNDRFEIVSPAYVHGYMDSNSPIRGSRPEYRDLLIV